MRKWIWTFGSGTKYRGQYVIVCCRDGEGDGREEVFERYGQDNCSMSYLFDKGMELARRYGWKCLGVVRAY